MNTRQSMPPIAKKIALLSPTLHFKYTPTQTRYKTTIGVRCFVGTLADIMRSGGARNKPAQEQAESSMKFQLSWPFFFSSDSNAAKASMRYSRAQKAKSLLAASRGAKPIKIPPRITTDNENDDEVTQQLLQQDEEQDQTYISNAVPFIPRTATVGIASSSPEVHAPRANAEELIVVLPWLFAAPGQIEKQAAEYLASQLALSRVHLLDFSRLLGSVGPSVPWLLGNGIAWVGATPLPSPTVAAAAALHRLSHRCGGILSPPPEIGGAAVLFVYRQEEKELAAESLAIYFHLYCGLEAKDAVNAAGDALRCPAPQLSVLDAGVQEMACCGKGWLQRVLLEWQYAGGRVEATGDAVGGWDRNIPLTFDVRHRKWKVQCWGLPPGPCAYKFIVDGRWCSDLAAPSQIDAWGNTNNVTMVPGCTAQAGDAERAADAGDGMAAVLTWQEQMPASTMMMGDRGAGDEETPASTKPPSNANDAVNGGASMTVEVAHIEDDLSPEERLRLARFGAGILSYYAKSATIRKISMR